MASRDCASNKIAGALIAVVVFAAAVTLLRVYVAGDHGAQGKTAAQVSLNDCAAVPVAVKLIEDGGRGRSMRPTMPNWSHRLLLRSMAAPWGMRWMSGRAMPAERSSLSIRMARSNRWNLRAKTSCSIRRRTDLTVPMSYGGSLPRSKTANEIRGVRDE